MIGQARVSFDLIRPRVGLTGSIDESGSERLLWIATAGADDGTHCVTSSEANEGARPTGDPSVRFFPPVAPPHLRFSLLFALCFFFLNLPSSVPGFLLRLTRKRSRFCMAVFLAVASLFFLHYGLLFFLIDWLCPLPAKFY